MKYSIKYLFSIKYQKIITFINQLLDIRTYLLVKKEFEIMKNIYYEDNLVLVEKNIKININNTKFTRDIKNYINKIYFIYFTRKPNRKNNRLIL